MDGVNFINPNQSLQDSGNSIKPAASREPSLGGSDQVSLTGSSDRITKGFFKPSPPAAEAKDAIKPGAQVVYADGFGQISHLGVQIDGDVVRDPHMGNEVFDTVRTLFSRMEPDTQFTIVVERKEDQQRLGQIMKDINMPNPDRVHVLMAPYNITSWMRDNMVMTFIPDDPDHSRMIDKVPFQSHDNANLPKFIADNTKGIIYAKDKLLRTDGGDVVSDDKRAYVGYDSIYLTAMNLYNQSRGEQSPYSVMSFGAGPLTLESPNFSKKIVYNNVPPQSHLPKFHLEDNPDYRPTKGANIEEAWIKKSMDYFKGRYSKEIVVMGADDPETTAVEKPATFHIDMGVTPVSPDTVLVGNPQMAMDIIKGWSKSQYDAANKSLQKETGASGDILGTIIKHNMEKDPDDPGVMRIQNNFESEVKTLDSLGKNIIRIPYLEGDSRRSTPWITYGNCIMQNFTRTDGTQVKNVFLPVYGIPLDDVAKQIYESQGFEVIPLKLAAFTSLAGAIRCMSNYLGRNPGA